MALWTPAYDTGLIWHSASDAATFVLDGTAVTEWHNKRGSAGLASQSDSSKKPTRTTSPIPAVSFNGTSHRLSVSFSESAGNWTFIYALNPSVATKSGGAYLFDAQTGRLVIADIKSAGSNVGLYVNGAWIGSVAAITGPQVLVFVLDYGAGANGSKIYRNGTVIESFTYSAQVAIGGSVAMGSSYDATGAYYQGLIYEQIVDKRAMSTADRQTYEGYLAHDLGFADSLPSDHPYRYAAPTIPDTTAIRAILSMPYALEGTLRGLCVQDYHILREFLATCDQVYGLRLLTALVQRYGDVPQLRAILDQVYGSAAVLRRICRQHYGDALRLVAELDQRWSQYADLRALVEQKYSISGEELRRILSQNYDLRQYADLRAVLDQVYVVSPGTAIEQRPEVSVSTGGLTLSPHHVSVECDENSYFISGEIHLADESEFLHVSHLQEVAVRIDDTTFTMIANLPRDSRPEPGRDDFVVPLVSPAVLLDAPYATAITREFDGAMASAISTEMAASAGIIIDWQLGDWYLPAATLYANGETPLTIIRKLTEAVGGIIQSAPDGSLICRPEYPQSLSERATATPAAYLTDQDNFFSVDSSPEIRDGYNRFLVSDQDQTAADTGLTLEQRDIDDLTKEVLIYRVPWTGQEIALRTSGGGWVRIVDEGVVDEQLVETVEIVAGEGRVSKPLADKVSHSYKQVSLGAITTAEDGHLATEVAGNSLVEITYTTRYHKFTVASDRIEEVQFYPEEIEP